MTAPPPRSASRAQSWPSRKKTRSTQPAGASSTTNSTTPTGTNAGGVIELALQRLDAALSGSPTDLAGARVALGPGRRMSSRRRSTLVSHDRSASSPTSAVTHAQLALSPSSGHCRPSTAPPSRPLPG